MTGSVTIVAQDKQNVTSSVYDCTVEDVFTTELVTDVFYIFNGTVVD